MADRYWVLIGGTGTWNATAGLKWSTTSGGVGGSSVPGAGDRVIFDGNSGTGTVTIGAVSCGEFDSTNYLGSFGGGSALNVAGAFTWGAGIVTQGYTGNLTLSDTSGTTRNITSNGKAFGGQVIVNGVGGVYQLADAFSSGILTVTNGSFSANGKTWSVAALSSSNSNARTVDISNSVGTITGSGTCWQTATTTNLTFDASGSSVAFTDSTASSKTMQFAALAMGDISISGSGSGSYTINSSGTFRDWLIGGTGSPTIQWHSTSDCRDLFFVAFNGTWVTDTTILRVTRDFKTSTGMTVTNTQRVNFTGTGTQQVTTNGISLATMTLNVLGTGNTVQLQDALTAGVLSVNTGNFDDNGKTVSCSYYALATGCTIGISTVWSVTGSTAQNVWDAATGIIFSAPPSLSFTNGANTTKVFNGGGYYYGTVTWNAAGVLQINDTGNVFQKLVLSSVQSSVKVKAGTTQTLVDCSALSGTAGNLNSIVSDTAGTQATLSKDSNFVNADYLSLQDINLTGGAFWYMGKHSTDAGNNNGVRFTDGVVGRAS